MDIYETSKELAILIAQAAPLRDRERSKLTAHAQSLIYEALLKERWAGQEKQHDRPKELSDLHRKVRGSGH